MSETLTKHQICHRHDGPEAMQFIWMVPEVRWEEKPFVQVAMPPYAPAFKFVSSFDIASDSETCARANADYADPSLNQAGRQVLCEFAKAPCIPAFAVVGNFGYAPHL